jgi:hypothetical protein
MPSIFSPSGPTTVFQVWFVVYLYVLPIALYGTWASLALADLAQSSRAAPGWVIASLALPLAGAGAYLLFRAGALSSSARRAAVLGGLVLWLVPLAAALWLAGGALGPKALS